MAGKPSRRTQELVAVFFTYYVGILLKEDHATLTCETYMVATYNVVSCRDRHDCYNGIWLYTSRRMTRCLFRRNNADRR